MNKALDEVRAGEARRMAHEGLAPVLKKSRWLLLKREENLKTEQRFRLRDLLRYNLKTVRAYLLKEACQVRISTGTIDSPLVSRPNVLLALNEPSLHKYLASVEPGGWVLYNGTEAPADAFRNDVTFLATPFTRLA